MAMGFDKKARKRFSEPELGQMRQARVWQLP